MNSSFNSENSKEKKEKEKENLSRRSCGGLVGRDGMDSSLARRLSLVARA